MRVLFKSNNLIGDALNLSPALRAWLRNRYYKEDNIYMQTLPDHVAPLYAGMVRDFPDLWFKTVFNRPEGTFDFEFNFDVNQAFIISDQDKIHIAESYAKMLGVELTGGLERLKPTYIPDDNKWMEGPHETLGSLKGCILISMFSASCESRDKNTPGLPPNKMINEYKWKPMLELLKNEYPDVPIRFLGAETDVLPDILKEFGEPMFHIPLNRLALIMQKARLLVTIDNGMAHLGASQEIPMFEMYPRCLSPHYILPVGNPNLVWVQIDPVHVNPAQLKFVLGKAIERFKAKEKVDGNI
jgi:hypothetical protein